MHILQLGDGIQLEYFPLLGSACIKTLAIIKQIRHTPAQTLNDLVHTLKDVTKNKEQIHTVIIVHTKAMYSASNTSRCKHPANN